jgi:hypothetical protein
VGQHIISEMTFLESPSKPIHQAHLSIAGRMESEVGSFLAIGEWNPEFGQSMAVLFGQMFLQPVKP